MQYRRDYTEGATYFFTVVVFRRSRLFEDPMRVAQLRSAIRAERARHPFHIDAIVVMPDHIHAVWTLPPEDADYSIRWRNIKSALTHQIETENRPAISARRRHKKEQAIWQPRFWEHRIRDEKDYAQHVDYTQLQSHEAPVRKTPSGLAVQQHSSVYPPRHFAGPLGMRRHGISRRYRSRVGWVGGDNPTRRERHKTAEEKTRRRFRWIRYSITHGNVGLRYSATQPTPLAQRW